MVMSLRAEPSTIRVAVVEALLGNEPSDSPHEHLDGEGLWKHGRRAEPIELLQRQFLRGAYDHRCLRIAILDALYPGAREVARVRAHANEIGDHNIGNRIDRCALQCVDEREVIALIAQHLADEVSYVAVVLDDQDLSYAPQAAESARAMQFLRRWN
jgi:hypothetical protein